MARGGRRGIGVFRAPGLLPLRFSGFVTNISISFGFGNPGPEPFSPAWGVARVRLARDPDRMEGALSPNTKGDEGLENSVNSEGR